MATTGVLEFEGWPGEEFRVQLSPVSMRAYLDFRGRWLSTTTFTDFEKEVATFVELAKPAWTVAGVEAFTDLDLALIKGIVNGWLAAVGGVPIPLPVASGSTDGSQAPSTEPPASLSSRRPSSSARRRSTPA